MTINYDDIASARKLLLDDIKAEFQGVPLSVDHYILAEHRLQTLIQSELVGEPTEIKIKDGIATKLDSDEG